MSFNQILANLEGF